MARAWSREDRDTMLENLERMGGNMTTWEEEFIGSVRAVIDAGRELTENQAATLARIYAQRLGF
jgi:hypothetical protein